ncbi:MAG: class I SAM-dependent methyltransferase [Candidatus Riesia sp.]|nr:class I SAM-dependent methyltransferase [Candidatus Riesia sp.]
MRNDIINKAREIQGWLRDDEYDIVYDLAQKHVKRGGHVVEVGSWKGKSAFIWASVCKEKSAWLTCIDTFSGIEDINSEPNLHGTYKEAFSDPKAFFENNIKNNLEGLPVSYIKGLSREKHKEVRDGTIDICFIDADHKYPEVVRDIKNFLPKVKKGGILCGHDYEEDPGDVKRAVDEIFSPIEVKSTIWIYKK